MPAIAFDLLIGQILCAISKHANNFNVPEGLSSSTSSFAWYWENYTGVGANPTWFLWALFLFDLGLVGHSLLSTSRSHHHHHHHHQLLPSFTSSYVTLPTMDNSPMSSSPSTAASQANTHATSPPPSEPSHTTKQMLGVIAAIASGLSLGTYLIRIVFPAGYFLPLVFPGFQLGYFVQYVTSFALGTMACKHNSLAKLPRWGGRCLGISFALFSACWIIFLTLVGNNEKGGSNATAPLNGGGGPQSLFFALFEQTFAVIWSLGLLVTFRERLSAPPSKLWAAVIGSAYAAYLIHPMAVFSFTFIFTLGWSICGPFSLLVHILIVGLFSVSMTWALAIAVKLIPGSGKVL